MIVPRHTGFRGMVGRDDAPLLTSPSFSYCSRMCHTRPEEGRKKEARPCQGQKDAYLGQEIIVLLLQFVVSLDGFRFFFWEHCGYAASVAVYARTSSQMERCFFPHQRSITAPFFLGSNFSHVRTPYVDMHVSVRLAWGLAWAYIPSSAQVDLRQARVYLYRKGSTNRVRGAGTTLLCVYNTIYVCARGVTMVLLLWKKKRYANRFDARPLRPASLQL